jgi:lauroyl/myristoyl acyltransferase/predicted MFS family arabinose efflux permease
VPGLENMKARKGFLSVFGNGGFSLLWVGTLTSQLGDQLNLMALTAIIFSMSTGATKGFEFSKILLLASAPVLIFAPISGVYADRLDRKRVMIGCDVLRALLVASIPLVAGASMIPVYVIVFLVFTINRFFLSARSAVIPQVVADEHLMGANSLLNAAMMATIVIGPLGGGILVEKLGYKIGFLADSATYVVSAVCVSFITLRSVAEIRRARTRVPLTRRTGRAGAPGLTRRPARIATEAAKLGREIAAPIEEEVEVIGSAYHGLFADLRHGFSLMRGSRSIVHSTVSLSAIMFVTGFMLVVCPVFVRNEMGVGTAGVGMLLSVAGVGMLTGSLIVGRFFHATPRRAIVALSFVLAGADIALIAGVESVQALALGVFFLGAFVAPPMVTSDTILQEAMPAEAVGKAFGFRDMIARAAFGVAGILSGVIVDVVGPRPILLVLSAVCIAYSIVALLFLADTSTLNLLNAYPLMRAGVFLAGGLPRRVSYRVAGSLADVAFLLMPDKRRTAAANIARVIGKPAGSREARDLARRMFRSYALYWVDFFRLGGTSRDPVDGLVRIEGIEHLKDALKLGRGAIFVSAHLGSWDMGGAALAATEGLSALSAIVEPVTKETSNSVVTMIRERRGVKVIPLGSPLGVGRALRRNEIVFVVGERLVGAGGVDVDFFGERTLLPRGAAYWSVRIGAPIVPGFCIRQPDGTFIAHIESPIMPDRNDGSEAAMRRHTQRVAGIMETYIARYPDQWCMLQPVWEGGGAA